MIRARIGAAAPGSVGIGAGGTYTSYSYDPISGLSNDPQLAPYLQSLTPAQVQSALDGGSSVTSDLRSLLIDEATGTGAAWQGPQPPATLASLSSVPMWAWILGGGVVALLVIKR
jgi:hypothetical protein